MGLCLFILIGKKYLMWEYNAWNEIMCKTCAFRKTPTKCWTCATYKMVRQGCKSWTAISCHVQKSLEHGGYRAVPKVLICIECQSIKYQGERTLGTSHRENVSTNGNDDDVAANANEQPREPKLRKKQLPSNTYSKSKTTGKPANSISDPISVSRTVQCKLNLFNIPNQTNKQQKRGI